MVGKGEGGKEYQVRNESVRAPRGGRRISGQERDCQCGREVIKVRRNGVSAGGSVRAGRKVSGREEGRYRMRERFEAEKNSVKEGEEV